MDQIEAAVKRIFNNFKRWADFVRQANDETPSEAFNVRLEKLEAIFPVFYSLIEKHEEAQVKSEKITFDLDDCIEKFENTYYELVTDYRVQIENRSKSHNTDDNVSELIHQQSKFLESINDVKLKLNQSSQHADANEVRLPKIDMCTFDGDFREWKSFHDLFSSTVHNNDNISNVTKFKYLKLSLKGDAANLLKHIAITDANYTEAWNKLISRYDKSGHIVNSFIKLFINQASITNLNAASLRKLSDVSDEVLRGLDALGEKAQARDPWLIYIIVEKLDNDTRHKWAIETAKVEHPTVQQLLDFLGVQSHALESLNITNKRNHQSTSSRSNELKGFASVSTENNLPPFAKCCCCKDSHRIYQCTKFKGFNLQQRREVIVSNALCYNCLNSGHTVMQCKSKSSCHFCKRRHHSLLHNSQPNTHTNTTLNPNANAFTATVSRETPDTIESFHTPSTSTKSIALLPTAIAMVKDKSGNIHKCRLLLDSGSMASFITESCAQRLSLNRKHARVPVQGLGSVKAGVSRGVTSLTLYSANSSNQISIEAFILNKISSNVPFLTISKNEAENKFLESLKLADPNFNCPQAIDILLGADYFFDVLTSERVVSEKCSISASHTIFGWIVTGKPLAQERTAINHHSMFSFYTEMDIDVELRRFWELEEVPKHEEFTEEEKLVEEHFASTHERDSNGRFIVRLPFKSPRMFLGHSLDSAVTRLLQMERRFRRNGKLKLEYAKFMREYIELNHMELVPPEQVHTAIGAQYYLPHHSVLKEASTTTKLRVVFDGSCKTSNNISLNDTLRKGPTIQADIFKILLRFRRHKYAITADAEKMYRQVLIHEEDRNYQRIVWRNNESEKIQHYKLNTVTYGTTPGSFLAIRSIHQLARLHQEEYPEASDVICHDFYVDDLMSGGESDEAVLRLQSELQKIMQAGQFHLRKWASNSSAITSEDKDLEIQDNDASTRSRKVLGICWNPVSDTFSFAVNLCDDSINSKRKLLSEISKIFDPLGWLSPVTVQLKLLFQGLWLQGSKSSWDDALPIPIAQKWATIKDTLKEIESVRILRCMGSISSAVGLELHGFCDASEAAYAAVVYSRVIDANGIVTINIVAAKTKVAPLSQVSLPRLELCGAHLLTKLFNKIQMAFPQSSMYAWTDSTIVLAWLADVPKKWKCFVANRTSEILASVPRTQWNHVTSKDNPADCASRGILPAELPHHPLWWSGPPWLQKEKADWPIQQHHCMTNEESRNTTKAVVFTTTINADDWLSRYSSWSRMYRITAWCQRFIQNARRQGSSKVGWLTTDELQSARLTCCKLAQSASFGSEIDDLKNNKHIHSSVLKQLCAFIDNNGILRVGGRIQNSRLPYKTVHPIILSKNCPLTFAIISERHKTRLHAGAQFLIADLRQDYWILNAKNQIKKVIRNCPTCKRHSNCTPQQLMGNLPKSRVEGIRAFLRVGVDYAGPFTLKRSPGRCKSFCKGYVALFICLATKALHLELASDMSTDAFLAAFKRFTSRRGIPSHVFSDNGTNFVGAHRNLNEMYQLITDKQNINTISCSLADQGITWNFIPPSAPHFGGVWEAGVKSVKYHLKRVVGLTTLTFEEMNTLLVQVEGILNSRPLCLLAENELDPLTPGHFLIGQPITTVPEENIVDVPSNRLSRWQLIQQMLQGLWKRWSLEYLTSLQQRRKWNKPMPNLRIGDIVLIKETNLPPSRWLLGRVIKCFPGADGLVRVATVNTKSGTLKRPAIKLIPLFTQDEDNNTNLNGAVQGGEYVAASNN